MRGSLRHPKMNFKYFIFIGSANRLLALLGVNMSDCQKIRILFRVDSFTLVTLVKNSHQRCRVIMNNFHHHKQLHVYRLLLPVGEAGPTQQSSSEFV